MQTQNNSFRIVFISADQSEEHFKKYYAKMPFDALSFQDSKAKSPALMKKFKVPGYPTLVLLEGKTGNLITSSGVMKVYKDAKGVDFPWRPKPFDELLGNSFENNKGDKFSASSALAGKYLALYFSAHWCPPCQRFTPELAKFYEANAKNLNLEIVFVSRDKNNAEFKKYFEHMPWLAISFGGTAAQRDGLMTNLELKEFRVWLFWIKIQERP